MARYCNKVVQVKSAGITSAFLCRLPPGHRGKCKKNPPQKMITPEDVFNRLLDYGIEFTLGIRGHYFEVRMGKYIAIASEYTEAVLLIDREARRINVVYDRMEKFAL